jgi:MFS family permease
MSEKLVDWARDWTRPSPLLFAAFFFLDSCARALLTTLLPLEALRMLGSARNASLLFSVVGWMGIVGTLMVPLLVRHWRPRGVYLLASFLLVAAAALFCLSNVAGLAAGMLLRAFAAACLLNMLSLYIMAFIPKRQLVRSEPLRSFLSAFAWSTAPVAGVLLFERVSPLAAYGLSALFAGLLALYILRIGLDVPRRERAAEAALNPLRHFPRYFLQPRLRLAWLLNFGRETWWVMFMNYAPVYAVTQGWTRTQASLLNCAAAALLLMAPLFGWLARRAGLRRLVSVSYLIAAAGTLGATLLFDTPLWAGFMLLIGAVGSSANDSVVVVTFLRAVKARERPEMTMVFSIYRDAAGLIPPIFFSLLLSFYDLRSVFIATFLLMLACASLARWIPRGM